MKRACFVDKGVVLGMTGEIPRQARNDSADVLQPVQWPIPVMAGPDRPSLYSFFRASDGLVRDARRVCQRTVRVDMVRVMRMETGNIHDFSVRVNL